MSRRTAIIAIIAVAILIIGGLYLWYSGSSGNKQASATATSTANPFGAAPGNAAGTGANNAGISGGNAGTAKGRLVELSANPTSGSVFFATSSNQDVLEYVDRATGNVYQYVAQTRTGQPVRLTNTTIPKIQQTVWSAAGQSAIYRYLNDAGEIVSFSGTMQFASSSGGLGSIGGVFLVRNLVSLAADPAGKQVFGILEKDDGSGSYGIVSNFDGTKRKEIVASPVSFWNVAWPAENTITMTTKPASEEYGYLYFLNPQTSAFTRILGGIAGLSTRVNSDASKVAYSASANGSVELSIYTVANGTMQDTGLATLADKCVWSAKSKNILYCAVPQIIASDSYPDAWYQGTESFSDNIWTIDTDTGATTELYQIGKNENASIDAMNLVVSPDGNYLAFQNKNDLSEWVLDINQ
ncbi:MAG: hypothetical protein KGH93_00950 [Patescibacteria group bacterium]|nr:hypothetical protein [Patescibacteria group bacterium]MDE1945748.1 hypothetical protein [Patescibacteria group bacterium]